MCEIFPEVDSCCGVASIRVGMMLIAVLSITTGAVGLGVVEQRTNINFESMFDIYHNVSNITQPLQVIPSLHNLISTTVVFMSFLFMFGGITLLFSTLSDQEGFAQMFVWLVFLNIFLGFIVLLCVGFQCAYLDHCLLGDADWLSGSCVILSFVGYLILWYYFCCVANSYVLENHA